MKNTKKRFAALFLVLTLVMTSVAACGQAEAISEDEEVMEEVEESEEMEEETEVFEEETEEEKETEEEVLEEDDESAEEAIVYIHDPEEMAIIAEMPVKNVIAVEETDQEENEELAEEEETTNETVASNEATGSSGETTGSNEATTGQSANTASNSSNTNAASSASASNTASTPETQPETAAASTAKTWSTAEANARILSDLNAERAANGVGALKSDDLLNSIAATRLEQIKTDFSHDLAYTVIPDMVSRYALGTKGFSESEINQLLQVYTWGSYSLNYCSECIARQNYPDTTVAAFMASTTGHRECLLDSKWDLVGIAYGEQFTVVIPATSGLYKDIEDTLNSDFLKMDAYKLFVGEIGTYRDEYGSLQTDMNSVDEWWNSL